MVLPENVISLLVWDKVVIVEEKQKVIKIIEIKITIKVELKKLLFMIKTSMKYSSPQNMAGVEGFEPSQAVLETDVLPLTLYP